MPPITVAPGRAYRHMVARGFSVILAVDEAGGIGKEGAVPWSSPSDMIHFRDVTQKAPEGSRNAVIMGRKTFDSLPPGVRPLPRRFNIVLTRQRRQNDVDSDKVKYIEGGLYDALTWLATCGDDAAGSSPSAQTAPASNEAAAAGHSLPTSDVVTASSSAAVPAAPARLGFAFERVFVLGGASIYTQAFQPPCVQHLHEVIVTRVRGRHDCDVSFDVDAAMLAAQAATASTAAPVCFHLESTKTLQPLLVATRDEVDNVGATKQPEDCALHVQLYEVSNAEEEQYLALCRTILSRGFVKSDRTGVGTRSIFGAQMRYSLRDGRIPLLTTKRVFWRGVCEELLWFLRGHTDAHLLRDKGVHIWDGNGSRSFLDGRGLHGNREGDLGPVYGFQWRHFGADYEGCDANYEGKGIDQLAEVVHALRSNPNDRRILFSAWNPTAINKMALPPCHVFAQFYVSPSGELSCQMYQRSCDMGLGVPFNIASYSLLTILLAKAAGLTCGDFIHTLGDAHVYLNHVEPLQQQLARAPRAFPYLRIKRDRDTLEAYQLDDFEIVDYRPFPAIKMEMAV